MRTTVVYVVSANPAARTALMGLLRSANLHSEPFADLETCLDSVAPESSGVLVFDAPAIDADGPDQNRFATACARMPTLVIADRGDVPTAVNALKASALVILERPFGLADLVAGIVRTGSKKP